jgi:hypothetical protein
MENTFHIFEDANGWYLGTTPYILEGLESAPYFFEHCWLTMSFQWIISLKVLVNHVCDGKDLPSLAFC